MKITCYTTALRTAVDNVKKAAAVKTEIEAMRCVNINAKFDTADLTCCDLQTAIRQTVAVTVQEAGSVCLNAKMLYEILRKLTGETVTVEQGVGDKVTIRSGRCKHTMIGISPEMFPEWPQVDKAVSVPAVNAADFAAAVRSVAFSVSTSPVKPLYTGIHLDVTDGLLHFAATDTFRMGVTQIEVLRGIEPVSCTVPAKSLTEAAKLISDEETVTLRFGERHLLIESDTCTVLSFLLDGQYLDYNAATPKTHTTLLHVNASEIADCIDRVSVWSNETIKAPLDLKVSATETECSMSTSIGASSDSVQTTAEGDDSLHIRFNGSFLSEALRAIGNQPTCIGMQGHSRPAKLWGKETPDTYYIVLPVRMRETEATV